TGGASATLAPNTMTSLLSWTGADATPTLMLNAAASLLNWTATALPEESAGLLSDSNALSDETGISLTRDQKRFLFGWYVYFLAQSLILLAVLKIMSKGENYTAIVGLSSVTGWSGHPIAIKARDAAWQAFDSMYPPENF